MVRRRGDRGDGSVLLKEVSADGFSSPSSSWGRRCCSVVRRRRMKWYELQEFAEFARFSGDADGEGVPFEQTPQRRSEDAPRWWERALCWWVELLAGK